MSCWGGRSAIRQLVRLGFNVALARDMTDAMYDPESRRTSATRAHRARHRAHRGALVPVDFERRPDEVIPGSADPDRRSFAAC